MTWCELRINVLRFGDLVDTNVMLRATSTDVCRSNGAWLASHIQRHGGLTGWQFDLRTAHPEVESLLGDAPELVRSRAAPAPHPATISPPFAEKPGKIRKKVAKPTTLPVFGKPL